MLHFLNFLDHWCLPSSLRLSIIVHLPWINLLKLLLRERRHQRFILKIQLIKYSIEVLLYHFCLFNLLRLILIQFLEEQPHVAHVVAQVEGGLILILPEVGFNAVHI